MQALDTTTVTATGDGRHGHAGFAVLVGDTYQEHPSRSQRRTLMSGMPLETPATGAIWSRCRLRRVAHVDLAERNPMTAMLFASSSTNAPRGRICTPVAAAVVAFLAMGLATPATVALSAAQGTPMTLKAAYDSGLVMISVEIAAQDKRGDRLLLTIEPSDKPLTIIVPTETTTLTIEKPFDVLNFRAPAAQKIALTAEAPARLVVNQVGERRFVSGKFQIAMDEGKPQFVGSATVDVVKPQ